MIENLALDLHLLEQLRDPLPFEDPAEFFAVLRTLIAQAEAQPDDDELAATLELTRAARQLRRGSPLLRWRQYPELGVVAYRPANPYPQRYQRLRDLLPPKRRYMDGDEIALAEQIHGPLPFDPSDPGYYPPLDDHEARLLTYVTTVLYPRRLADYQQKWAKYEQLLTEWKAGPRYAWNRPWPPHHPFALPE